MKNKVTGIDTIAADLLDGRKIMGRRLPFFKKTETVQQKSLSCCQKSMSCLKNK